MSQSENPYTDVEVADEDDEPFGFDHPRLHRMLAARGDDGIERVWLEYRGDALNVIKSPAPALVSAPGCGGEEMPELPDGWALLLWADHDIANRGLYCFECDTHFEDVEEGNDHFADPQMDGEGCYAWESNMAETVQTEVPDDD